MHEARMAKKEEQRVLTNELMDAWKKEEELKAFQKKYYIFQF